MFGFFDKIGKAITHNFIPKLGQTLKSGFKVGQTILNTGNDVLNTIKKVPILGDAAAPYIAAAQSGIKLAKGGLNLLDKGVDVASDIHRVVGQKLQHKRVRELQDHGQRIKRQMGKLRG